MPLYDHLGNVIDTRALKREQAAPAVTGVRQVLSGHPAQGLTPQRLASILRQAEHGPPERYLELAEEMEEKDLHYLSVLGTRKRAVSQLEVTVEAASDDAAAVALADEVREWLRRDELADEMFDILDAVGKGFSLVEIMWETSAKQWWPARLEWRDPRWFEFSRDDGRTPLLRDAGGPVPLSAWKFICHQAKAKSGLPVRGGLARAAGWAYLFKNYTLKDWVAYAEIYGQPLRVGKYHPGATEAEKDILLRAVASIGSDAAAIVPESMMIEFIEAKSQGTGSQLYRELSSYLDQQVSKAVLGQTATTDAIQGGYAVGKVHEEVRVDIERSDARQLAAALNRDVVRPFVALNHGPQHAYPRIVIGRPEEIDITALSSALTQLVPLGLKVSASEVRDKLGMAEPDDDEEVLAPPAAPPMFGGLDFGGTPGEQTDGGRGDISDQPASSFAVAGGSGRRAASAVRRAGDGSRTSTAAALPPRPRDAADGITDRLEDAAAPETDEWIDTLRSAIEGAASMADIADRLLALAPELRADQLAELLRRALVMAELAGRAAIIDRR